MNLAEALNAALPDLPDRKARVSYPKVDPGLIWQENTDDGEPVIVAMIRGRDSFFRFPPEQWNIIELFDGTRSWEDVAALHSELYGTRFDPDDLREFTSSLDAVNFWYRTPLEKTSRCNRNWRKAVTSTRTRNRSGAMWRTCSFQHGIRIDISIGFIPG